MPRARTEEAEFWTNAVYAAVQEIPPGKVTNYGCIARLLGFRTSCSLSLSLSVFSEETRSTISSKSSIAQRARQVGVALKHLPRPRNSDPSEEEEEEEEYFNIDNVPWQRVINSMGQISHRY